MSHKLRGSVLALPASHYLRDFLSPTLSSVSILLGCTFLSQGMESGMSLSGVQQKERRRRNLGSKMLWRVILALDQGSMKLGFSALTWQHSWVCLGHSPTTLSRGMISSVWALQRSASGLLWGRCGENPNSWLSAGEPRLRCASLGSGQLRLHGSVVSLPFLSPRETPLLRHRASHEETKRRLEKTGTVLLFTDRIG